MKSFYNCSFFEEEINIEDKFSVQQQELVLKSIPTSERASFKKLNVAYDCSWKRQSDWDSSRPTILIPTKDQYKLISFTISNLKGNNIDQHCNIIIIDDRSTEDIKTLTTESGLSYLRVDNKKGFNFSMLNNIAMKICDSLGVKEAILWNSDLWVAKEEYLLEILKRHREENSTVSGTKLLYPPAEMSLGDIETENIKRYFPHMVGKQWRETIQFGGDSWTPTAGPLRVSPGHYKRFCNHTDSRVNCDRGASFITGAFQLWNVSKFIELGGLNPSLAKNFQDTDLCLKAISNGIIPMYFGKDIFFYHDESPTLNKEGKEDLQMVSDHTLFGKIWNDTIESKVF
jgi:GT2 family glycosyltransferase